jgi:hypothetical protein
MPGVFVEYRRLKMTMGIGFFFREKKGELVDRERT